MSVGCKLWAGMGNQMFMVAATIGYAKKHSIPYWIPRQTIAPHVWPAHFSQFPPPPKIFANRYVYKEPSHEYREIPKHDNIILEGYFQTEKYFKDARAEVLSGFQIPYQKLEGFVSIHVRRGDYLRYPDKHPVVTEEYLMEAIKYCVERGYNSFIVCSDDLKWCREKLRSTDNIQFTFSQNNDHYSDLALMSCCEHNICSNSSFSWWGYWLNQNPSKIGIFPSVWFGPGNSHLSTIDIYPENCVII